MDYDVKDITRIMIEKVYDWNWAESRILPRLQNINSADRKYFEIMPHKYFLDLIVTYYIPFNNKYNVIVTYDYIDAAWGIDEETLHKTAISNLDPIFHNMNDLLSNLIPFDYVEADVPMIVITSPEKTYGAATILSPDIYNFFTENQILFPSSVHEWIAVPCKTLGEDIEYMNRMVNEINATELQPQDILSGHIYWLNASSQKIQPIY